MSLTYKDFRSIRQVVLDWYGLKTAEMVVMTREEEIEEFENENDYISPFLWEFVNHHARQVFRWSRDGDMEFVVWCPESQSYRMIQDLCFKDSYPDARAWNQAILDIVRDPAREVYVVLFSSAGHPSATECPGP